MAAQQQQRQEQRWTRRHLLALQYNNGALLSVSDCLPPNEPSPRPLTRTCAGQADSAFFYETPRHLGCCRRSEVQRPAGSAAAALPLPRPVAAGREEKKRPAAGPASASAPPRARQAEEQQEPARTGRPIAGGARSKAAPYVRRLGKSAQARAAVW